MIRLAKAMGAWGSPDFVTVLKAEVEALDADLLPLQQGLVYSSRVADAPPTLVVHDAVESGGVLSIRGGIFYQGIDAGCSCADDPTPEGENNEYCEVRIVIDMTTASATVDLVAG